ncbi:glycosyltransferase family 10 domain-containing protein [Pigmentibacter ruber]
MDKKVAFISYDESYNVNNLAFDKNAEGLGYFLFLLKSQLKILKIDLLSPDSLMENEFDGFMYIDISLKKIPKIIEQKKMGKKIFLILSESEIINTNNWKLKYHKLFDKIFTWNPDMIDNIKYFQYYWPIRDNPIFSVPSFFKNDFSARKLLCIMAGNKNNSSKNELYSLRLKIVDWFNSSKYCDDLHLYGPKWENGYLKVRFLFLIKINFFRRILNLLNKNKIIQNIFLKKYKNYQGVSKEKRKTLSEYKFCICFENAKNISGYITEKIFDCFFSGTIPIYLGINNPEKYFPGLFIDMKKFSSIDDLYNFLKDMPLDEYIKIRENIQKYIQENEFKKTFLADYNAEKMSYIVREDIK